MHSGYEISQISFINQNLNPSIEVDTTGYALISSTISRDLVEFYKGLASLKTITSNLVATEGFKRTVTGESEANKEYTFSLHLKGSGTVILRFYDDVAGNQDGTVITLSSTWTRYSLTKTFGVASTVREVQVVTDVQQAITFYTDALQHELGATASAYTENKISAVGDIGHYSSISFILPILDDGNLHFVVSELEGSEYVDLKKADGTLKEITAGTGGFAIEPINELAGHRYMKIVSATQQTADRNIKVIRKWR